MFCDLASGALLFTLSRVSNKATMKAASIGFGEYDVVSTNWDGTITLDGGVLT